MFVQSVVIILMFFSMSTPLHCYENAGIDQYEVYTQTDHALAAFKVSTFDYLHKTFDHRLRVLAWLKQSYSYGWRDEAFLILDELERYEVWLQQQIKALVFSEEYACAISDRWFREWFPGIEALFDEDEIEGFIEND